MREVAFGSRTITYTVDRGDRVRARLVVNPLGLVEVRIPQDYPEFQVPEFVAKRSSWIVRQQAFFDHYRPRETPRRYVSGESLRYLGRQYRLRVVSGSEDSVRLRGRTLLVVTASAPVREIVDRWLRARAEQVLRERFDRCLTVAKRHGVRDGPMQIRQMRRRWGSCTPVGRILLNPKLVQTPVDCIDYVVVHELCHRRYPNHGASFYRLLDVVLPDWRARRERLSRQSLPDW